MAYQQPNYFIGASFPLEPQRPVQEGDTSPAWYAFQTPPLKEIAAQAWLERKGVEAWFPTEPRRRRLSRGKRPFVEYEGRVVPRYIFARFTGRPRWDALMQCRWLTRVVGVNGAPLPVTDAIMSAMAQVPQTLEAIRKAEAEKRIVRPGDKVRIITGAMQGWVVDVTAVHAGIAKLIMPLLGKTETNIDVSHLEKVARG